MALYVFPNNKDSLFKKKKKVIFNLNQLNMDTVF